MYQIKKILLVLVLITLAHADLKCTWEYQKSTYLATCANGLDVCQQYNSLDLAKSACIQSDECYGITKVLYEQDGSENEQKDNREKNEPQYVYELRGSSNFQFSIDAQQESWVKKTCEEEHSACYTSEQKSRILDGCIDGCPQFDDLDQALEACTKYNDVKKPSRACGGVSYVQSNVKSKQGWVYQLRLSNQLSQASNSNISSWQKIPCVEQNSRCDYGLRRNAYLQGCAQECVDFDHLVDAQRECDKDKSCTGVTYSTKELGGARSQGSRYQLRSGATAIPTTTVSTPQTSWLKANTCKNPAPQIMEWSSAYSGFQLGDCADGCVDYSKLQEAINACSQLDVCDGITYSQIKFGGNQSKGAHQGTWGYQLRKSTTLVVSENKEISWVKNVIKQSSSNQASACYSGKSESKELISCINGCLDYDTLETALKECTRLGLICGGVTYADKSAGSKARGATDGMFGFQLRKSNQLFEVGNPQIISWQKIPCVDVNTRCDFQVQRNQYLEGCIEECSDFKTLLEAQSACDQNPQCGGVTWSNPEFGGNKSQGKVNGYGYQLRASTVAKASSHEYSWVKNNLCPIKDENEETSVTEWSRAFYGVELKGCCQDCVDFGTLEEAILECKKYKRCGGITYAHITFGGQRSTGPIEGGWGYQLRESTNFTPSNNGEFSWVKYVKQIYNMSSEPVCYSQEISNTYIKGCALKCQDFENLEAAQKACNGDINCGGITKSSKIQGGASSTLNGGYQLRVADLETSPNGESSWRKIVCPPPKTVTVVPSHVQTPIYTFSNDVDDSDISKHIKSKESYNHQHTTKTPTTPKPPTPQPPKFTTIPTKPITPAPKTPTPIPPIIPTPSKPTSQVPTVITPVIPTLTTPISVKPKPTSKVPTIFTPQVPSVPKTVSYPTSQVKTVITPPSIPTMPTKVPTTIVPPKKPCPQACVIFYTECNFQGQELKICESSPKEKRIVYKSALVPKNVKAKVFSKSNYIGNERLLTESLVCDESGIFILAQFQQHKHMSVLVEFKEEKINNLKRQHIQDK